MKRLSPLPVLLLVTACGTGVKEAPRMEGAYFLTSEAPRNPAGPNNTELKQLRIYTPDMVMFAQVNPADSASGFGVGTYSSWAGGITENELYGAHDSVIDTPFSTRKAITRKEDGFTVVMPPAGAGVQSQLTETYRFAGKGTGTPLDGVWKQVDAYTVSGKDSVKNVRITTQYKSFYRGFFMWGQSTRDAYGGRHAGVGFGTFEWISNARIKETDLYSTFSIIAGQTFNVDIRLSSPDGFTQAISYPDGTKSVEVYTRVKK